MTVTSSKEHVEVARRQLIRAYDELAQALVRAGAERLPAHTSRQLGVLWNGSLQLWDDLERMLAGGALNAPTQPGELKE